MRGRNVEVHGPQACTGVTAGLDENGFLRVKTAKGFVTVQTGGLREKIQLLATSFKLVPAEKYSLGLWTKISSEARS